MQHIINTKNLLCQSLIDSTSQENTNFIDELKNIIYNYVPLQNECTTTCLLNELQIKVKIYNTSITTILEEKNTNIINTTTNLTTTLNDIISTINNHNCIKYKCEINKIIENFNIRISSLESYNDNDKLLIRKINDEQIFAFKLYNNKVYQIHRKNESDKINVQIHNLLILCK